MRPLAFISGRSGLSGAQRERSFRSRAATLAAMHTIPLAGIVLILGVDRFVNPPRALINIIGNSLGAIIVALWERDFDKSKAGAIMPGALREAQR